MSISSSGLASRSFIIGSRLWPPAITRASGPRSASRAIALSTLVARAYSMGAGVCTPPYPADSSSAGRAPSPMSLTSGSSLTPPPGFASAGSST